MLFAGLLIFFVVVYLPTFLYPYLLADETWTSQPGTDPFWGFGLGRPLFSIISWLQARYFLVGALDVIYVLRATGVVGLAVCGYLLVRWLQLRGHDRWSAIGCMRRARSHRSSPDSSHLHKPQSAS